MWWVWWSRQIALHTIRREELFCAWMHWWQHPLEFWLDLTFGPDHCRRCADWESAQARGEASFLDRARQEGWI